MDEVVVENLSHDIPAFPSDVSTVACTPANPEQSAENLCDWLILSPR